MLTCFTPWPMSQHGLVRSDASGELDHTLGVNVVWATLRPIVLLGWWEGPATCPLTPSGLHHTLLCFSDGGTKRRPVLKSRSELTWGCPIGSTVAV
ncbi:hypothetical protein BHM03_00024626 [Ensete ventricosum]|nr:hypothetical protein BHM03_00024626 [Ensete ventricosum]